MRIFLDGIIYSKQHEGGINRLYREVIPLINQLDGDIEYVLYLRRKYKGARLPVSQHLRYLPEQTIYPWRWWYGKGPVQAALLQRAYNEVKPDIFQSTYFTRPDILRTPYVVTVLDMMDEIYADTIQKMSYWGLVKRKTQCLTSADLIFSVSHCTTTDLLRFHNLDRKKVITISLGVGPPFRVIANEAAREAFLKRHHLSRPFLLYVGVRGFVKNFSRCLHAYAGFKGRKELDLVAVGGEKKLAEEDNRVIAKNSLAGRVKHLKQLTDEELVMAYNTARAFIYPSLYEGFGLPLLEAMACGTPVLASNTSSIPEVAGDAALYFDPHDIDGIRSAMDAVLQNETAAHLIRKGKERVRLFSWEETARTIVDAYKQLL